MRFQCLVLFIMGMLLMSCSAPEKAPFTQAWEQYVAGFYDEGRIVDTGNNNVSHSEGQGYGMLFAVAADDQERFDALWQWTSATLQRSDKLFSWRYTPCPQSDRRCVDDGNNASDGDLLIAWALLRAAERWQQVEYRKAALAVLSAMRSALIISAHSYVVLLPGAEGFSYPDGDVQVNLSYWIFPALQAAADATGDKSWDDLAISGIELIQQSNEQWSVTPDWLRITAGGVSLRDVVNPEFGFNACRIPLQLAWQNVDKQLAIPFLNYWQSSDTPATRNLATGKSAEYAMTPGMEAVRQATTKLYGGASDSRSGSHVFTISKRHDYYSASLIMLSLLALKDGGR